MKIQGEIAEKTVGNFSKLFTERNSEVFKKYFGEKLYSGSLNIKIELQGITHQELQEQVNKREYSFFPKPDFIIPDKEIENNKLRDAVIWKCELDFPEKPIQICKHKTWIFRRIDSRMLETHQSLEIVASVKLRDEYDLQDEDKVHIIIPG